MFDESDRQFIYGEIERLKGQSPEAYRRELVARLAVALCPPYGNLHSEGERAKFAVSYADAIIAELDKEKK